MPWQIGSTDRAVIQRHGQSTGRLRMVSYNEYRRRMSLKQEEAQKRRDEISVGPQPYVAPNRKIIRSSSASTIPLQQSAIAAAAQRKKRSGSSLTISLRNIEG